ncbi:class I SAM-dependent methyltransferase [Streptomyces sp. NPDC048295]|uniref:class I SAM-dependent methyltransferase n=1 Tax=Streptomyces sp. NPDC048295 TaxID=3154617 RepID=UPI0034387B4F
MPQLFSTPNSPATHSTRFRWIARCLPRSPRPCGQPAPGLVAELGCGPGYLTAHLLELELDAFGVDLSPVMIDLAGKTYPDLRFEIGSTDAPDLADGRLQGIMSWYSVIHTPPQGVPRYSTEFRRVLAPEGTLLLAFFESEGGRPRRSTTR